MRHQQADIVQCRITGDEESCFMSERIGGAIGVFGDDYRPVKALLGQNPCQIIAVVPQGADIVPANFFCFECRSNRITGDACRGNRQPGVAMVTVEGGDFEQLPSGGVDHAHVEVPVGEQGFAAGGADDAVIEAGQLLNLLLHELARFASGGGVALEEFFRKFRRAGAVELLPFRRESR